MADNMDMDIDIDIDLGDDTEIAQYEAESMNTYAEPPPTITTQPANGVPAAYDSDIEKTIAAPDKVHVRGLDSLTTADIKQFASEHYSLEQYQRVEWIDDTSANIVYNEQDSAAEALANLSAPTQTPVDRSQLRRAKPLSAHPQAELYIRQAYIGDAKIKGARDRSRFYLMNPEQDPGERRQDSRNGRSGRGRYDNARRSRPAEPKPFDVSMYDDDATPEHGEISRRQSVSSYSSGHGRKLVRFDDGELLPAKSNGRLRDRSASPVRDRDGDGRYGFSDDQPRRRTARHRSLTPPPRRRNINQEALDNSAKELFPSKATKSAFDTPKPEDTSNRELFPNHSAQSKRSRELFPNHTPRSNHRRTDALDAGETAYIVSPEPRDLASRITGGPKSGRNESDFNFKGKASGNENTDFSIRGASAGVNQKVKELFPLKSGNAGKELFSDKIQNKSGPRRRAEDLF